MAEPDNLKVSTSVVVDLPADRFDLADWMIHFSSEEYVACTPATHNHKYSDVYRGQCHGNSDSSAVRRRLASSHETNIV